MHNPHKTLTRIKDVCEKAFQRAIFNGVKSTVDGGDITWIDFELPIGKSQSGRDRCFDLIGIDENGRYVICELKFSRKSDGNGGPDKAGVQVIEYLKDLKKVCKGYKFHDGARLGYLKPLNEKTLENARLIVAANDEYWRRWYHTDKRRRLHPLNRSVEYYSVAVESDCFFNQKGLLEHFKPILPKSASSWKRVE